MSRAYKIHNPEGLYFTSFAPIAIRITRIDYRDIILDNLSYCQKEKGLLLYAWCLMTNHIHMIVKVKGGLELTGIIRDF
jgi:hypothetical protein